MAIEYSPATRSRNMALVLLCKVTLSAFRPRMYLVQRASSFQYSLKPASKPLSGPARSRSSRATTPLYLGLATSSQVFGKRHDLKTHRRQSRIVQKQGIRLHGVVGFDGAGGAQHHRRALAQDHVG